MMSSSQTILFLTNKKIAHFASSNRLIREEKRESYACKDREYRTDSEG